jgi:hypothetical protein
MISVGHHPSHRLVVLMQYLFLLDMRVDTKDFLCQYVEVSRDCHVEVCGRNVRLVGRRLEESNEGEKARLGPDTFDLLANRTVGVTGRGRRTSVTFKVRQLLPNTEHRARLSVKIVPTCRMGIGRGGQALP